MDNFVKLKLNFRAKGIYRLFGSFQKKKVGFLFTQYAWFFAFDLFDKTPSDFEKMDYHQQFVGLATGAANYWALKNRKKEFSKEEIEAAIMRASMQENQELGKAIEKSTTASWMKYLSEEDEESPVKKK